MKLTIYHGTNKPFIAIGKHQCKALQFAFEYPTWHYYNEKCRDTKRALWALYLKGAIVFDSHNRFHINMNVSVL